jgi:glycosyltransferase involved in cell wall biosynthesis
MAASNPSISIVVPVHNERAILEEQVLAMRDALAGLPNDYEILLVENGSTDETPAICARLSEAVENVRRLTIPQADYGLALKQGILDAAHDVVVIFNVEFWSVEFVTIALAALQTRSLVIGSKSAPGATDDRPRLRRFITRSYNRSLRVLWGFTGTDTHGMKAFHRVDVVPLALACRCTGFVFDTELVLRCERAGLRRLELPTDVREIRAPSSVSLLKRVPSVLVNLGRLWRSV